MAEQRKREKLTQYGDGTQPGKHTLTPLFITAFPNAPDGETSSVSNLLLSSENFLISGFGTDTSAPSE